MTETLYYSDLRFWLILNFRLTEVKLTFFLLQVGGSILPASVISLYCMYLCYSGLASEPRDYECNGLHKHSKAVSTGTMTIGLLTTVLSVVYSAVRAGSSTTLLSPPDSPRAGMFLTKNPSPIFCFPRIKTELKHVFQIPILKPCCAECLRVASKHHNVLAFNENFQRSRCFR